MRPRGERREPPPGATPERRPRRICAKRRRDRRCWSSRVSFGAWYGNRQVWFLGTDDGGRVALYRGLPYELPFGIDLYSKRYSIPIQTDSLSPERQDVVTGHDALPRRRRRPDRRHREQRGRSAAGPDGDEADHADDDEPDGPGPNKKQSEGAGGQ